MRNQTCFHCSKLIEDPLDYNMMPVEKPYINLFFHKNCFKIIGGYGKMSVYLTLNGDNVLKLLSKLKEERQK